MTDYTALYENRYDDDDLFDEPFWRVLKDAAVAEERLDARAMVASGDWWVVPIINPAAKTLAEMAWGIVYRRHAPEDFCGTTAGPIGLVIYLHKRRLSSSLLCSLLADLGARPPDGPDDGPFVTLSGADNHDAVIAKLDAFQRWLWDE